MSIKKIAPASYVGTADDVIGSAKGIVSGEHAKLEV